MIDGLGISSAYLVAQDWGAALAFHLAARRPDLVRGLAFMEFIRLVPNWADFHQLAAARETFRKFRTAGEGEAMILDGNAFIERVLPGSILRKLGDDEMAAYRAPFQTRESRRPMLALPRDLPIEGEPTDVHQTLKSAQAALSASTYPKLLFVAEPGALVSPPSDRISLQGSNTAPLFTSVPGGTICRRIMPRPSDTRSPAGSPGSRPRPPARGGRPPELTRDAGDQHGRRIDHLLPALRL